MTRLLAFLVHNWPLKAAAVVLSSLLYGTLVLTQNTRPFTDSIPIRGINQAPNLILMSPLGQVSQIRYFVPDGSDIVVSSSNFIAEADLSDVDPTAPTNTVPVEIRSVDPRIRVFQYSPRQISVRVERVSTRQVPVVVKRFQDPPGLDIREPEVTPALVSIRGSESVVRRVAQVEARVQIDPSGISFERDVELIPVDAVGEPLNDPVDIQPSSAHVRIAVFTNGQTRSVAVTPNVVGVPAPGFEIASVSVTPLVVPIEGEADQLTALTRVDTAPISVAGATSTIEESVPLALPTGVVAAGPTEVRVTITLRPVTATRTFSAGILLAGARSDRTYDLSTDRILVTLGGSVADLDRLEGRTFDVSVQVAGLGPGVHEVPVVANLPAGLALVAASPPNVSVTIGLPVLPSSSPSSPPPAPASASPSPPPSASP